MGSRDHQAQVGHMRTGRVEITHDRQAAHDPGMVLSHEDSYVSRPSGCRELSSLVADASPVPLADEPSLGLRADLVRELDESTGITWARQPHPKARRGRRAPHATTTP
jgi:hypothetical protein